MILLDTCALLWLVHKQEKLSTEALQLIEDSPVVYISAITGFEIGMKSKSGKLQLPVPPHQWFNTIVKHHDLAILGLDLDICIRATELPPIHRDPCDRFIIATAIQRDLTIITTDSRFKEYGVKIFN